MDAVTCADCLALQGDKQAKALFQMFIAFEPKGLSFTPNEAAVLDEINANTLEGVMSVASVSACEVAYCPSPPLNALYVL